MSDSSIPILAALGSILDPDEEVWAVFGSGPRQVAATSTRLFLLGADGLETHDIRDFSTVRRARDSLVVLERPGASPLGIVVDPDDERGLQALTVIGLLVATGGAGAATQGGALDREPPGAVGRSGIPERNTSPDAGPEGRRRVWGQAALRRRPSLHGTRRPPGPR